MFKKMMERYVDLSLKKPWWVIGGAALITLFFIWQASTLKLAMTWMDMMPQHEPAVQEYQQLLKTFGSIDQILVVVDAQSEKQATQVAQLTAQRLTKLNKWVKRVDYTIDTDFIKEHGLMLMKEKDLKRFKTILANPNLIAWLTALNNDFEKEYIEGSGDLKKDEKKAAAQLNGLEFMARHLSQHPPEAGQPDVSIQNLVDRLLIGDRYMLSSDRKMAMLTVQPIFTIDDTTQAYEAGMAMQAIADTIEADHPGTWIGLTGMPIVMKDEMKTAQEDSMLITLGALLIITLLFIVTFRMLTAPLLAMGILLIGIIWDYGLAGMIIGKLTMFSAMSALLLIGLGVDYLMHFLNGYFEARASNQGVKESIIHVYHTSGRGIVLGALTTSLVFFSMILTDYPAMVEFGITMGLGIVACMLVTLLLLPAILILRERRLLKKEKKGKPVRAFAAELKWLNQLAAISYKKPLLTLLLMAGLTVVMVIGIGKLGFDHNYLNIEAKGLESVALYDILEDRFDLSADALMFTTDTIADAENKTSQLDELTSVGQAASIALYCPSHQSQEKRKPVIQTIQNQVRRSRLEPMKHHGEVVKQINRLSDNIIEMGQMGYISGLSKLTKQCDRITGLDENGRQAGTNLLLKAGQALEEMTPAQLNNLNALFFQTFKQTVLQMANFATIELEDVRRDIRERYISPDGKLFLVEAYSRKNIYKHMDDTSFIDDVQAVSAKATGMPTVFKRIIELSAEKGQIALLIAGSLIILILLISFRSIKMTLLALLPMMLGYVFMFGTLGWIQMPLTIVSVMMLPLIVGIGIDDGIHLIHRYQIEGKGSQPILIASTGKAIFLTTLTTMLGFGSLIFAKYQGFGQMGWVTLLGVGWCFIMSVLLIPAILKLMERGR